jgi:hypothetical protein
LGIIVGVPLGEKRSHAEVRRTRRMWAGLWGFHGRKMQDVNSLWR